MKLRFPLLPAIKTAAALCFSFLGLPVFALFLIPTGAEITDTLLWRQLAVLLLSGGVGVLFGAQIVPRVNRLPSRWSALLANLLAFLAAVGCGAAAVVFWMRFPAAEEGWRLYFAADAAGLLSFAAVSACCRLWERDYDDILTNHYLTALVILDVVACIACWLFGRRLELGALSVTLLLAACVHAAAKNQGNIDFLTEKRSGRSISILPRRMRWYSFSLIVCVCALIFAGYLLRGPIAWVFSQVLELLRRLVGALLRMLPEGEAGDPLPEEIPSGQSGVMGLPPAQGEPSIFWTVFGVVLFLLFLGLLFFYRREIWKALCTAASAVRNFIRNLLFHRAAPSALADVNQYFADNVEELSRQSENFRWRERKYDLRRWKKEYRAFRAMKPGGERMREGYRLAMMLLLLRRTELSPADTPEEIRRKAEKALPPDLLRSVTEGYCRVRYDGAEPDAAALDALAQMLAEAAQ